MKARKLHGRTCKQYIFRFCKIYFQRYTFGWKSFYVPMQKRRQKGLMVSNFTPLLVVFKWYHGSEGVKQAKFIVNAHKHNKLNSFCHNGHFYVKEHENNRKYGSHSQCTNEKNGLKQWENNKMLIKNRIKTWPWAKGSPYAGEKKKKNREKCTVTSMSV